MTTSFRKIIHGNALSELKKISSESINCVVTSPPYFKHRDYKVEGQLGQERTPDEYLSKLIRIFAEVHRVLKKNGSCWIVISDTFATRNYNYISKGSLCLIPQRFQLEMVEWLRFICRNTVIYHKTNAMPSSIINRFTIDFEYVLFFTKNERYYFKTQYEPMNPDTYRESRYTINLDKRKSQETRQGLNKWKPMPRIGGHKAKGYGKSTYSGNQVPPSDKGRIKRAVWSMATQPFKKAHFAVYPEKLIDPIIKACVPPRGTVLDPFMGTGTTGLVAKKNNVSFIGIEISNHYINMARERGV